VRFSWKALVLSPLVVPLVYSTALVAVAPGKDPLLSFLVWFGLGSIFSLAVSILLLLPALFLMSRFTPLTARATAVVGAVLGGIVFLPVAWQSYLASGDNSGPPQDPFASYLQRQFSGMEWWPFPLGGLVTAVLYWVLARGPARVR
jgi:hypothetical protein